MLSSAKTNSFCTEFHCLSSVSRIISIGSDLEISDFISPIHQFAKIIRNFRINSFNLSTVHFTCASVYGYVVAFRKFFIAYYHSFSFFTYDNTRTACYTAFAHTSCNYCSVGSHAASCSQNTFCCNHSGQIFRRSFFSYQKDFLAFCCSFCRFFSCEVNHTASSSRRCR